MIGRANHGLISAKERGIDVVQPADLIAAASGKKSDPRFGEAELRLLVIGGDAVMAGKRQFERAAETGAVDCAN